MANGRTRGDSASMLLTGLFLAGALGAGEIGREVAVARHLEDGQEYSLSREELLEHGKKLFSAIWTGQEGGGRPLSKGNGKPLVDPSNPLLFPRNFNRISAPDANSCAGCHNLPRPGGGGDIVANVFVLGQRFDHVSFDPNDSLPTSSSHDESGAFATLSEIANSRATIGMYGSGYIEALARQITGDLLALRNGVPAGGEVALTSKQIAFGTLRRAADGTWDVSNVEGLPPESLKSTGPSDPPSLVIRPFHQAGAVISLREFTNNAFNHHHGIQTAERFGRGTDPDGDGFVDEMTRADVTAATVYQATLPAPGRVIPRVRAIEEAIWQGEQTFAAIGCAQCHVAELPLVDWGWTIAEPNPYNPAGNLRPGDAPDLTVNLNSGTLPGPRLHAEAGVTWVAAFTDFKLHDITSGPGDPNREFLDMHSAAGSDPFFAGNGKFLTKRLWGAASEPPYYHHGKYTTLREATLAHAGEAEAAAAAFRALPGSEQDAVIEFMKSLQILPDGSTDLIVDAQFRAREWPPSWSH